MIAQRIKALRTMLNLSRAAFGRRLGVSRDVINNLERGRVRAKDVFVDHLCEIYGVNKAWLTDGEGDMLAEPSVADIELMEATEAFNALSPNLKKYAMNQLKGLLEIQNTRDNP